MNQNCMLLLKKLPTIKFDQIIDIGCAEGYYAVGFAKFTDSHVHAYDINEEAITFAKNLASINNVDHKITFSNAFSSDTFKEHNFNIV